MVEPISNEVNTEALLVGRKIPFRFNRDRNIVFINPTFPNLPPLVLDVNPETLNKQFQKSVNVTHSRGAVFREHWGVDQLTQVSASGSTLGFGLPLIRDDPSVPASRAQRIWELQAGIVRHRTLAAENFHHMLQMFLNSGSEFNPKTGQADSWQEIVMWFAGELYLGYFTSFDWEDSADMPFRWTYSFNFMVTFTFFNKGVQQPAVPMGSSPAVDESVTNPSGALFNLSEPFFAGSEGVVP